MEAGMSEEDDIRDFDDLEDGDLPPDTAEALTIAMMEFNGNFSKYIKEMNPELWKKAVDYAVTFTKIDGITFEYIKTETQEDVIANIEIPINEDEDYNYEGSDDEWEDLEDDAD
jgi:hypothetical protein